MLLEGGVFGLEAEHLSIDRTGCGVGWGAGCRGGSSFLQTLVLLFQLLDLRTQLETNNGGIIIRKCGRLAVCLQQEPTGLQLTATGNN